RNTASMRASLGAPCVIADCASADAAPPTEAAAVNAVAVISTSRRLGSWVIASSSRLPRAYGGESAAARRSRGCGFGGAKRNGRADYGCMAYETGIAYARKAAVVSIRRIVPSCGFPGSTGPRLTDVLKSRSRICCSDKLPLAAHTLAAKAAASVEEKLVPDIVTSLPFSP